MRSRWLAFLMAFGLALSGVAQAQNILILTTADKNDDSVDQEWYYMRGILQEFAAPLNIASCTNTPQTVIDPVSGLSKTVTCNHGALVNGTALDPDALFAPGYDLVVVASAHTTIDAADWPGLQTAIANRLVRGAVLFIDTVNAANANQVRPLLDAALNNPTPPLGNGTPYGSTVTNAHALNTAAAGAGDFVDMLNLTLTASYYPYTNVPYENALYLDQGPGPVSSGTTSAVGVFVPSSTSFGGNGACIFGANDVGWADISNSVWPANAGKVGKAFLKAFNNPGGVCGAPIADPPVLDITKTTTASTTALPANGATVPYTLTVKNTSSVVANNVTVTDAAPAGLSFGAWTCTVASAGTPSTLTACPAAPLPSGDLNASVNLSGGAELRFTVNATVTSNSNVGALTNVAALTLPAGATCAKDPDPCEATVEFIIPPVISPVLDIAKTTTTNTAARPANGATVRYTVTVSNTPAAATAANNVIVTDNAPAGLSYGAWTCAVISAGTPASICPAVLPSSGNLNVPVNLSGGAVLQFTVDATVTDNSSAANLTSVATLGLPAGATCAGGRAPCDATVAFNFIIVPSVNAAVPVPGLNAAGLALLALSLATAGFGARRARRRGPDGSAPK
jgi:uncharacterized repeat protein (TIGR01451 family)